MNPILWIGKDPESHFFQKLLSLVERDSFFFQRELIYEAYNEWQAHKLLFFIEERPPALIIIQNHQILENDSFFEKLNLLFADVKVILITDKINEIEFKKVVNIMSFYKIIKATDFNDSFIENMKLAIIEFEASLSKKYFLRNSKNQIREMEKNNFEMEKKIKERTLIFEKAKEEEEKKLQKLRKHVQFIDLVSRCQSLEEVLQVLRKSFKGFSKISEPLLLYKNSQNKLHVISFQNLRLQSFSTDLVFSFSEQDNLNNHSFSYLFAKLFQRPFLKILSLPLSISKDKGVMLCVENDLSKKELISFFDYFSEIIEPLNLVIDRILIEQSLFESSYLWEKTFTNLRDPILLLDKDYNILRTNSEISSLEKCYQFIGQKNAPCETCPLISKQEINGQTTIRVGNKLFEVHAYSIKYETPTKITHFINQYIDVTEKQALSLKLIQTEKIGALGLLAGNIAHELNNPLTGLRSMAQILIHQSEESSQFHKDLIEIEKAAVRCQNIIKNLVDFSKGEDQELQLISLDEIIEKTLPFLKTAMRHLKSEIQLNTRNVKIKVEPSLIQQVLFNLINNACQAMEQGGLLSIESMIEPRLESRLESVKFEASLSKEAKTDESYVQVIIRDTGLGIPEENLNQIFEPFFTTKAEGQGTGLGLSLSKNIIDRYKGRLSVQSKIGVGSSFTVTLPVNIIK